MVSIAQTYEITVDQIVKWNPLESKRMHAGRTLNLFSSKVSGEEKSKPENNKKIKTTQRKSLVRADQSVKTPSLKKNPGKRTRTLAKGPKNSE